MQQLPLTFDRPSNGAPTSRRAAQSQSDSKIVNDRTRILDYLREQAEHGGTRWEIHRKTGVLYQTVCARVREMVKKGRLIETERTRLTANGSAASVLVAPINS